MVARPAATPAAAPFPADDKKLGLAPVVAPDARVLLLGSFPGEESLRQQQYYAHPRNQFWRLLGDVFEEPLPELDYPNRLVRLRARRVGVWDVITRCRRDGSLDSNIRHAEASQFDWLRERAPALRVVGLNGQKAGGAAGRLEALGFRTLQLPSSSPAFTRPYEEKLASWLALRAYLQD